MALHYQSELPWKLEHSILYTLQEFLLCRRICRLRSWILESDLSHLFDMKRFCKDDLLTRLRIGDSYQQLSINLSSLALTDLLPEMMRLCRALKINWRKRIYFLIESLTSYRWDTIVFIENLLNENFPHKLKFAWSKHIASTFHLEQIVCFSEVYSSVFEMYTKLHLNKFCNLFFMSLSIWVFLVISSPSLFTKNSQRKYEVPSIYHWHLLARIFG